MEQSVKQSPTGLLGRLRSKYACSMTHRAGTAIRRAWCNSWTYALLTRIFSAPPACETASVARRTERRYARLSRFGEKVLPKLHQSVFYHIYSAVFTAGRNSRILGRVFETGFTGILLILIALYTVLDFLLRDLLSVPLLSSYWDEMLLVVSAIWVVYLQMKRRPPVRLSVTPMDLPVWFFLITCLCLFLLTSGLRDISIHFAGLRATAQYMLWFFLVARLLRDDKDFYMVYRILVVVATCVALYGVYQFVVGAPIPESWTDQAEASVRTRVYSIFSSPNIMGDFMVMFAPMAAGLAYSSKKTSGKRIAWCCTLVMCLGCLFTMSRGAWMALIVAVLVFSILVDRRLILALLVAGVAALFIPFVGSRIGYLFTSAFAESSARGGRSVRWETAIAYLHMFNPAIGIGFGRFGGAIAMQNQVSPIFKYFYTDNYYIKILAENGYAGLVSFVIMMVCLLFSGIKSWFRCSKQADGFAPLSAGLLAGLSGVLVHCFFENIFEEPYMMAAFWTLAALLMYVGFLRKKAAAPE